MRTQLSQNALVLTIGGPPRLTTWNTSPSDERSHGSISLFWPEADAPGVRASIETRQQLPSCRMSSAGVRPRSSVGPMMRRWSPALTEIFSLSRLRSMSRTSIALKWRGNKLRINSLCPRHFKSTFNLSPFFKKCQDIPVN